MITKIQYCEKCGNWRGTRKICPDCKVKTIEKELPKARGDYYFIKGIDHPLSRVTKIIGDTLAKPALIGWAARTAAETMSLNPTISIQEAASSIYKTRDKAGARGTDVHHIIDNIIKGGKVDEEAIQKIPQVMAYRKFCEAMPHKVIFSERTIWDIDNGFAGTADALVKDNSGKIWLLDWKTSKGVYNDYFIQLSAYKHAIQEMNPKIRIDGLAVVHLQKNGNFGFHEGEYCFDVFLNLLEVFKWLNKQK